MMKKSYKYKLNPTTSQKRELKKFFGSVRFIYNWGLNKKIQAYKEEGKNLSYTQLSKELTLLKKEEKYLWLNDCVYESLQQSLRCLDTAFTNFFRKQSKFPQFKSKRKNISTCKFIRGIDFDFTKYKVKIPKIGWIKLCKNRSFNKSYKKGTLTISQDKCGDFWAVIIVETNEPCKPKTKVYSENAIGIDLGIKEYAILSNGVKYTNPKYLEKGEIRLKNLQRHFSRTQKDSKRREKLKLKIAQQHRKIANRRNHFLHNLTSQLINKYDTICLEDLNVKGMLKNKRLAHAIGSVSWSEFVRQLTYKADWYGKNIIFIGRFQPSTKTCHCCGYINNQLTLKDRSWICPKCKSQHDRDVNAAINIKNFGLQTQTVIRNITPEKTGVQSDGEGKDISLPMKRLYL